MPVGHPIRFFATSTPSGYGQVVPGPQNALSAAFASICPDCQRPFGLIVSQGSHATIAGLLEAGSNDAVDYALHGSRIETVPQSPLVIETDPSLPEIIREPFACLQEDAVKRRNASGVMQSACACLDVALKDRGETSGGRRTRIQNLAERKIVTQSIADWAQSLWEEGSDASHDLTADIDRAIEHVEFLKLFFEVVYVLPDRIEAAKSAMIADACAS